MKVRLFSGDFEHINQIKGNSVVVELMAMPRIGERIRVEGFASKPHIRFFVVEMVTYPTALGQKDSAMLATAQVREAP